jgi:hypothetical protein
LKASSVISRRKAPPKSRPRIADSSCSTVERFGLTGPSITLDPRFDAYRSDLADIALAGRAFAPRFAQPVIYRCGDEPLAAYGDESEASEALYELRPGEAFAVLDIGKIWSWGYRCSDHRVGYVLSDKLLDSSPVS